MELNELNPPRRVSRRLAIVVVVCAVAVIGLWLLATPAGVMGKLSAIGYAICHQIVARSFLIDGSPMPLCARCTGIYLGVVTGFVIMQATGRGKNSRFPDGRVSFIMMSFVVIMALDGINSYIHLFPGGTGIYEPQNWLRLVTGIFAGFAIFTGIFPVFNAVVWADPVEERVIHSVRELLGMCAILVFVVLLVLSGSPLILLVLAFASIAGVVGMLTMIGSVLFVTMLRMENTFATRRALAIPIMAGLLVAFVEIGGVDAIRLLLTGTWAGLNIGG